MIGILALQGNYYMHREALDALSQESILVKNPDDLNICKGLIIPGGESTVISKMIKKHNFLSAIKRFAKRNSIFGTCAGLILMSNYQSDKVEGLGILDIDISRNAWGSQVNSFTELININMLNKIENFKATFIRAPKIIKAGDFVEVLSDISGEIVMVKQGKHLGTTFHPEMHSNTSVHEYFLDIANGR